MPRVERPMKPDYFPVFPLHLLGDEDYEGLDRAEWGSVFLLMQQQWIKGGTLPDDPRKLAGLAKCSPDELEALLAHWPKLKPVEGQPGRVAIPWLLAEYDRAMAAWEQFSEKQAEKGKASAASRKARHGSAQPNRGSNRGSTNGSNSGSRDAEPRLNLVVEPPSQPIPSLLEIPNGISEVAPAAPDAPTRAEAVVGIWNEGTKGTNLPKARITPSREKTILTRLKDPAWIEDFRRAVAFLTSSEFHRGKNERGWVADIDFALQPGKATNLAEKASVGQRASPAARSPVHRARADAEYLEQLAAGKATPKPQEGAHAGNGSEELLEVFN